MCPVWQEGKSFIYLLGLVDGRTKVGVTGNPKARLQGHKQAFEIAWVHFFSPAPGFERVAESYALRRLAGVGQQIGRSEVFNGINKADAIKAVREGVEMYRAFLKEMEQIGIERDAETAAWLAFREQYVSEPIEAQSK